MLWSASLQLYHKRKRCWFREPRAGLRAYRHPCTNRPAQLRYRSAWNQASRDRRRKSSSSLAFPHCPQNWSNSSFLSFCPGRHTRNQPGMCAIRGFARAVRWCSTGWLPLSRQAVAFLSTGPSRQNTKESFGLTRQFRGLD